MGEKIDYKKNYKHIYLPPTTPVIIDVPAIPYIMISGAGNPNGEEFSKRVEALYSLSYAVKMSYKGDSVPDGYYEYTVFPLEGIWSLSDISKPITDKDNYIYTIMIRQPDFLTEQLFQEFREKTKKKKPNPYIEDLKFGEMNDGLCCQIMHIGSFDDEPQSFAKMDAFCQEKGYIRTSKTHREIYLSDPRKTDASKMKTVLRYPVKKASDIL